MICAHRRQDLLGSQKDRKMSMVVDKLGEVFDEAGFDSLWFCGGWFAGIWTGPQHDLICVKKCSTNEEGDIWLSPEGKTPEEATRLALEKRSNLAVGQRICHRCGSVGEAYPESGDLPRSMEWCLKCRNHRRADR